MAVLDVIWLQDITNLRSKRVVSCIGDCISSEMCPGEGQQPHLDSVHCKATAVHHGARIEAFWW